MTENLNKKRDKAYFRIHKMVFEIFMYNRKIKHSEVPALSGLV